MQAVAGREIEGDENLKYQVAHGYADKDRNQYEDGGVVPIS